MVTPRPCRGAVYAVAPEATVSFRYRPGAARTPAVPWNGITCRDSVLISLTRQDSHPAAMLQRALRHRSYMVPSNSR